MKKSKVLNQFPGGDNPPTAPPPMPPKPTENPPKTL